MLLVALLVGAAGTMAAQGCFSVGEDTKVQFAARNWRRPESQDLFKWTEVQPRLASGERLLSKDEWVYLFTERTDAYRLYARALVDGTEGLVILPDRETWHLPDGLNFEFDDADDGYATNRYTSDDWALMDAAGAIFLPAAGYSTDGKDVLDAKRYGSYWTSSLYGTDQPYIVSFDLGYLYYDSMHSASDVYRSVRTVEPWTPQGIDQIVNRQSSHRKFVQDGQLLIEHNGKTYNVLGTEVK